MSEQPVVSQQQPPANLMKPVTVTVPEEKKSNDALPNGCMYKSLLCRYAQKSSSQPPNYQTINEGSQHQPQFRSRVWINGDCYKSTNTFSHLKAAEMEVSKIAFLAIMQKIKDAGANLIREDITFCKSIMIEYAVRMNLEKPIYQTTQTTQPDASVPLFFSLLVFNGVTYSGEFARNKMEAQRLAARKAILSILEDTGSGNIMSEIINSKFKLHAALKKAKSSLNVQVGIMPGVVNTENDNGLRLSNTNESEVASCTNNLPTPLTVLDSGPIKNASIPDINILLGVNESRKPDIPTSMTSPPATSVGPVSEQTPLVSSTNALVLNPPNIVESRILEQTMLVDSTSGQKRRHKNKKKAQKKTRVEAQLPFDVVPLPQIPPCSVAK